MLDPHCKRYSDGGQNVCSDVMQPMRVPTVKSWVQCGAPGKIQECHLLSSFCGRVQMLGLQLPAG